MRLDHGIQSVTMYWKIWGREIRCWNDARVDPVMGIGTREGLRSLFIVSLVFQWPLGLTVLYTHPPVTFRRIKIIPKTSRIMPSKGC